MIVMGILGFFKRKKKTEELQKESKEDFKKEQDNMGKIFDIMVTEIGSDGKPQQRPENGIHASSAKELIDLYAQCDQRIKILREYSDSPETDALVVERPKPIPAEMAKPHAEQAVLLIEPPVKPATVKEPETVPVEVRQKEDLNKFPPSRRDSDVKFFSIAGIECKLENGKIYQKQWMKLIGTEAAQYRLISDTNNREIPLNGKHLEVLKWVLIEDDQNTAGRMLING